MKKLFLSSYFTGIAKVFPDFSGDCSGKKVVFIPTASLKEKMPFHVGSDKNALKKLGMIVTELEISSISQNEIVKNIVSTDYIFVSGGNTFFLLQELKRKGVDKMIVEHINNGKLYIGSSAGSIVLTKDIGYIKIMEEIGYSKHIDPRDAAPDLNNDFSSLSVIDFYIVPHYNNFPFKKAAERTIKEYSDKLDLRPISNNQAIVIDCDKVKQITI